MIEAGAGDVIGCNMLLYLNDPDQLPFNDLTLASGADETLPVNWIMAGTYYTESSTSPGFYRHSDRMRNKSHVL